MRPSALLLKLLALWFASALLLTTLRLLHAEILSFASMIWWSVGGALFAIAAIDVSRRKFIGHIEVQRNLPDSFAVGVSNHAELIVRNHNARTVHLHIAEDHPAYIEIDGMPATLTLPAHGEATLRYRCTPHRRGDTELGNPWLRLRSRWQLWEFYRRPDVRNTVHVFPNFVPLMWFEGMDFSRQMGALGVHRVQRRGEGMDFHQLRAFREGDAMRQIDWKASARYQKPISREYQEERDQDIIFLLDCGRRMRAKDGELSHFDHALNAMLVTSHVALRQGDAVGLLSFAGTERWFAPLKGRSNIERLLHSVYDLHSSTATSDFLEAAQQLLTRQRKRALIVLLTTIRAEDSEDLQAALKLLQRRHLVLVANLREYELEQQMQQPVSTLNTALLYTGIAQAQIAQQDLFARLRQQRVNLIDALPQHLHRELVNQYWQMKLSGAL